MSAGLAPGSHHLQLQLGNALSEEIHVHTQKKIAHDAVRTHTRGGGLLDIRFGFALFRDRRVSLGTKLLAVTLGAALTGLLIGLELPFEAIVTGLLNLFGLVPAAMLDGLEAIVGPLLFAALFLPHLTPKELATRKRVERANEMSGVIVEEPAVSTGKYVSTPERIAPLHTGR